MSAQQTTDLLAQLERINRRGRHRTPRAPRGQNRRRILLALAAGPLPIRTIVARTGIPAPIASVTCSQLRALALVDNDTPDWYLTPAGVTELECIDDKDGGGEPCPECGAPPGCLPAGPCEWCPSPEEDDDRE